MHIPVDEIRNGFLSDSKERREQAIQLAVEQGDALAPLLIDWFFRGTRRALRRCAYTALKEIQSERFLEELQSQYLDKMPSEWHTRRAIEILERSEDSRSPQILTHWLKLGSAESSSRAALALAQIAKRHQEQNQSMPGSDAARDTLIENVGKHLESQNGKIAFFNFINIVVVFALIMVVAFTLFGPLRWFHSLIAYGVYKFWRLIYDSAIEPPKTSLSNNSLQALKQLGSEQDLGLLIRCTKEDRLRRSAMSALSTVLENLKEEKGILLPEAESKQLMALVHNGSKRYRTALFKAMPFLADKWSEGALIYMLESNRVFSTSERKLVESLLPAIRERVDRMEHKRILLRAVSEQSEADTLMRAPDRNPELPAQQLLRAADGTNEE